MRVAIIGAGMSGLSCADGLTKAGHDITLFDKGRGPGGRMSTRRMETPLGQVSFDHGAQYFTARDPAFLKQVKAWESMGVATAWSMPAPDAWVGAPGMNAIIKAMAEQHDVRWGNQVERLENCAGTWSLKTRDQSFPDFDSVVLAIPAEQALPFLSLHDFTMAREAMLARSQPCWTAMFTFAAPLPGVPEIVRDHGNIGWAARNNAKPQRSGPEGWVVQARPEWSRAHVEDCADQVIPVLLQELAEALGADIPSPIASAAHRWRYAMSGGLRHGAMWNADIGLGLCADWLLGPRVECAWLSGQALAGKILGAVTATQNVAA